MGLRLIEGINLKEFEERFQTPLYYIYNKELNELSELGLIELTDERLKLSEKGLYLANEVFERFIPSN